MRRTTRYWAEQHVGVATAAPFCQACTSKVNIQNQLLLGFFAVPVLALVAAIVLGSYSLWLVPIPVAAYIYLVRKLIHGEAKWKRDLRDQRDDSLILLCQSGRLTPVRSIYRLLPADPRCRLCLVPFNGYGKLVGVRPSRKNENFCPS